MILYILSLLLVGCFMGLFFLGLFWMVYKSYPTKKDVKGKRSEVIK